MCLFTFVELRKSDFGYMFGHSYEETKHTPPKVVFSTNNAFLTQLGSTTLKPLSFHGTYGVQ